MRTRYHTPAGMRNTINQLGSMIPTGGEPLHGSLCSRRNSENSFIAMRLLSRRWRHPDLPAPETDTLGIAASSCCNLDRIGHVFCTSKVNGLDSNAAWRLGNAYDAPDVSERKSSDSEGKENWARLTTIWHPFRSVGANTLPVIQATPKPRDRKGETVGN